MLALLLLGVAFQTIASEIDRRSFLPPGQILNVNGHPMHIDCSGEGNPTVILEAAGGHFSVTWAQVQPLVAQVTHVCAYDRAGYGWSTPGPEPRDATQIADDLHSLLTLAAIEPPYVMVGHSVGGIYVRVYSTQYAGEVVGMVLVDATHPDNWTRQGESLSALQTLASASSLLSRVGLMRLYAGSQTFGLPAQQDAALRANIASTQYWDTQRADVAAMNASLEEGRAAGHLGDMPLAVLSTVDYPEGSHRDIELALQRELANLSSNSHFQQVDGAGHISLVTDERYAKFVAEAIALVLESARTGQPLTQ